MGSRSLSRRLIVMRHAKSSWKDPSLVDRERPLNKRGRRSARAVAAELARLGWAPDAIVSSDSERTSQTVDHMRESVTAPASFHRSLYLAGITELRAAVAALPTSVRVALVLGHSPGWDEAVAWLTGQPQDLKTADAALLTGTGRTWAAALARTRTWTMTGLIRSRDLIE